MAPRLKGYLCFKVVLPFFLTKTLLQLKKSIHTIPHKSLAMASGAPAHAYQQELGLG